MHSVLRRCTRGAAPRGPPHHPITTLSPRGASRLPTCASAWACRWTFSSGRRGFPGGLELYLLQILFWWTTSATAWRTAFGSRRKRRRSACPSPRGFARGCAAWTACSLPAPPPRGPSRARGAASRKAARRPPRAHPPPAPRRSRFPRRCPPRTPVTQLAARPAGTTACCRRAAMARQTGCPRLATCLRSPLGRTLCRALRRGSGCA